MEDAKIARINALAQKAKTIGLSEDEIAERKILRDEYIAAFRESLTSQLENVYIKDEDGNEIKLKKKDEQGKPDCNE